MKKEKMDKLLLGGIILNAVRLFLDSFIDMSDFISGVLLGVAITMMLIGIYQTGKEIGKNIEVQEDSEENAKEDE